MSPPPMAPEPALGFSVSNLPEPHRSRTRSILREHPEVRQYIGKTPATFLIMLAAVALQIGLAVALRESSWWLIVPTAALVGAFTNHALWVVIHEATHNLIFKTPGANTLGGHHREPAARPAELRVLPALPPEAPRVPGRLRAGRRHSEPLGGAPGRDLALAQGDLAPALPARAEPAAAAPARDPADRPLGRAEPGRPGRLRRGRVVRPRSEGVCLPLHLVLLQRGPPSPRRALDPGALPALPGPGDQQLLRLVEPARR